MRTARAPFWVMNMQALTSAMAPKLRLSTISSHFGRAVGLQNTHKLDTLSVLFKVAASQQAGLGLALWREQAMNNLCGRKNGHKKTRQERLHSAWSSSAWSQAQLHVDGNCNRTVCIWLHSYLDASSRLGDH